MCQALSVSRSGFYAWRKAPVGKRQQAETEMLVLIKAAHEAGRKTYGSPRVAKEVGQKGTPLSKNRAARLMRKHGIRAKTKRKFKHTTDSSHRRPVAPNLLAISSCCHVTVMCLNSSLLLLSLSLAAYPNWLQMLPILTANSSCLTLFIVTRPLSILLVW